jgi:hypothetical protein
MFDHVTIRVSDHAASERFCRQAGYARTAHGAFLFDPDGNSAEAVHHDRSIEGRGGPARPGDTRSRHSTGSRPGC